MCGSVRDDHSSRASVDHAMYNRFNTSIFTATDWSDDDVLCDDMDVDTVDVTADSTIIN